MACVALARQHRLGHTRSWWTSCEHWADSTRSAGGYLACEPYVEDVVAGVRSETVTILPMLMSDGYFSKTVIPQKLRLQGTVNRRQSGQRIIQCSPLGLSRMMADVMVAHILKHCNDNDLIANETAVIITGHGSSKDQASRLSVSMQVQYIRRLETFKDVQAAFLEEAPGYRASCARLKVKHW